MLTRNVIRVIGTEQAGTFNASAIINDYVTFMQTPGSHNDTYASTAHRMFFKNLVERGLPLDQCPDNDRHNVDTTDGITMSIPIGLLSADSEEAMSQVQHTVALTRKSQTASEYATFFASLLRRVASGENVRSVAVSAAQKLNYDVVGDVNTSRQDPVTA